MPLRHSPRLDEADLLRAIDLVYQASIAPSTSSDLLAYLNRLTVSEASTLLVQDLSLREGSTLWQAGADPALAAEYEEWAPQNIYLVRADPLLESGVVMHGEAVVPDREVLASDYFNGYLRRAGVLHNLGTCIVREQGTMAVMILLRRLGLPSHSAEQKRFIEALVPHLQRAVAVHRRLTGVDMQRASAQHALDRLSIGVLFLDAGGKAMFLNRAAREIVKAGDGIDRRRSGHLRVHRAAESARLQRLIAEACMVVDALPAGFGGALRISRPSGKRPFAVLVVPARGERFAMTTRATHALVFVSDPDQGAKGTGSVLRDLYGLTSAEAGVAELLLEGHRAEEIADRLSVTLNTARTHVRRILEKCGARGQADLLRMLAAGPASLLVSKESTGD